MSSTDDEGPNTETNVSELKKLLSLLDWDDSQDILIPSGEDNEEDEDGDGEEDEDEDGDGDEDTDNPPSVAYFARNIVNESNGDSNSNQEADPNKTLVVSSTSSSGSVTLEINKQMLERWSSDVENYVASLNHDEEK